jgi:hypothetical protein
MRRDVRATAGVPIAAHLCSPLQEGAFSPSALPLPHPLRFKAPSQRKSWKHTRDKRRGTGREAERDGERENPETLRNSGNKRTVS